MKKKEQICFQGKLTDKHYFEGWYYKLVTADKKVSFAIIVGIATEEDPHAFIQVLETIHHKSYYIRYNLDEIIFRDDPFSIQLKQNYFSKDQLILNIQNEDLSLKTNLFFSEMTPYHKTRISPTIMGPFSYLPMKCSHGIISMHHYIDGVFFWNHEPIDFEDGYGYSEKDYGTSFPKKYIWMQSNTPKKESRDLKKISFMASVADIPFGLFHFEGHLCVLQVNERQYKFTTYNGAKLISYHKKKHGVVMLEWKKGPYLLTVHVKPNEGATLIAPKEGVMASEVEESLTGELSVLLKKNGTTILKQRLVCAGVEIKE